MRLNSYVKYLLNYLPVLLHLPASSLVQIHVLHVIQNLYVHVHACNFNASQTFHAYVFSTNQCSATLLRNIKIKTLELLRMYLITA